MTTDVDLTEIWAESVAETDTWCASHPRDAAIRAALVEIDAGFAWGPPLQDAPVLMELSQHTADHTVSRRDAGELQAMLGILCARNGGDVGSALRMIATMAEYAGRMMRNDPNHVPGAGAADLYVPERGDGWHLLGWGLVSETWWVVRNRADTHQHPGRPGDQPDRRTMRMTTLADRHGAQWFVYRVQRVDGATAEDTVTVRFDPDQAAGEFNGNVAEALARMTQAVVGPAIPIPGRGHAFWRSQGDAR